MQATDSRLIQGRLDFQAASLELIGATRRRLQVVDRDLSDWAWDRPAVITQLERVLDAPGSALRIVLARGDFIEREAPRLNALRRRCSDRIQIRLAPSGHAMNEGLLLGDASHLLRRAAPDAWRGRLELASPAEVEPWLHKFDALWGECETELPLTTIGL